MLVAAGIRLLAGVGEQAPLGFAAVCGGATLVGFAVYGLREARAEPPMRPLPAPAAAPEDPVERTGEPGRVPGRVSGGTGGDPGELVRSFRVRRTLLGGTWPWFLFLLACIAGGPPFIHWAAEGQWETGLAVGLVPPVVLLIVRYVIVRTVAPPGGWRSYLVFSEGLVVDFGATRLVVRWEEVRSVRHRPMAMESGVNVTTTHPDFCELTLEGTDDPLRIAGARGQGSLSKLIVDHTRERILRRLTEEFEQAEAVRLGELTLSRDGAHDAYGRFLPWNSDWRFGRGARAAGAEVIIRAPGGLRLSATVPEPTVATALLEDLARGPRRPRQPPAC